MAKEGTFWSYLVVILFGMAIVALGLRDMGPTLKVPDWLQSASSATREPLGKGQKPSRSAPVREDASTHLMGVLGGETSTVPGLSAGKGAGIGGGTSATRARMTGSIIGSEDKEQLNSLVDDVMAGKEPRKR